MGLFPVQLLEAALNLVLFACFCAVFRSRARAARISCTGLYLCAYAVIRFLWNFCAETRRAGCGWPVHFPVVQHCRACGRNLAAAAPQKARRHALRVSAGPALARTVCRKAPAFSFAQVVVY